MIDQKYKKKWKYFQDLWGDFYEVIIIQISNRFDRWTSKGSERMMIQIYQSQSSQNSPKVDKKLRMKTLKYILKTLFYIIKFTHLIKYINL